ncbi:MAG: acetyl-CoA carboxylase biotin carboxylase subunit [Lachnospirales bacterium]
MFNKILVANRGEIAVRIIRAAKELGIRTVAVYSQVDKDALHTQLADEAICIGPSKSVDSYLNMQNIITAAYLTNSEAIHPGFGFLAENSTFANMCKECNIKFIGPDSKIIDLMGNKANARRTMMDAKVPVIPGSDGLISSVEEAYNFAREYGYPVMIKASAGGGGKGIRIIRKDEEMENAYNNAKQEAKTAFLDDSIYMEKVIENAKHIEVQILGDNYGNVIHLYERDCSLQRKNQKVLEEAPASVLTEEQRKDLGKIAVRAAKAVNYCNAGTIEFLYSDGNIYFMEMNTRIQVEHPITEQITSVDIVKEQIKVASGQRLSYTQDDIKVSGVALECRINAENPAFNFAPMPGSIDYLFLPGGPGIRIDSCVYAGYKIPPFYDSMIAKLIVHGNTREEAIERMKRALNEFVIDGVKNNIDFQLNILNNTDYLNGDFDTGFIEKNLEKLIK